MGKSKDTFGDFLIPIVFGKLPSVVRRNLTHDHTSEEWNIDELRSSIEKEITILESGLEHQGDHSRSTITGSFYTSVRKGQSGQQSGDKRVVSAKPVCVYCKGAHNSAHCNVVIDVKARLDVVSCVLIVWVTTRPCTVILRTVVECATGNIIVIYVGWAPHLAAVLVPQFHRMSQRNPTPSQALQITPPQSG